jgi:hypothetical protein
VQSVSAVLKAQIRVVKSSERTAHALDCAYCERDALTMSRSGLIVIKAAHGEDSHPAAITIQKLLQWGMPFLDPHTRKDLRQMLDEAETLDGLIIKSRKNKLR